MNGLREKIADAIAGAISQDDRYLEHADAVLRVLAEYGDTQQVREQLAQVLNTWAPDDLVNGLMSVISPLLTYYRAVTEHAEADLAAARQQLDQVRARAALHAGTAQFATKKAWVEVLRILDAPARPAGHDETGQ
jgi:hypothetical protein